MSNKTVEITERELEGYKNTQKTLSGLLKGEHGAIITKCNIEDEDSFEYRLDIPSKGDYDSFQAMYNGLLAHCMVAIADKEILQREISKRNWFHKLLNL